MKISIYFSLCIFILQLLNLFLIELCLIKCNPSFIKLCTIYNYVLSIVYQISLAEGMAKLTREVMAGFRQNRVPNRDYYGTRYTEILYWLEGCPKCIK